ncbi:hypothetical protein SFC66_15810 [Terribacillus saccharophilus]|uniref:hypothetical protein n=1 Tax=Terribacillus saccharophilus TaxID=361277 RepID=UPI003981F34B
MLADIIGVIVLLLIFGVLLKFKVIKLNSKKKYVYKQSNEKITITYDKFNGFEDYYFKGKQDHLVTLSYEVQVEGGELILQWPTGSRYFGRGYSLKMHKRLLQSQQVNADLFSGSKGSKRKEDVICMSLRKWKRTKDAVIGCKRQSSNDSVRNISENKMD